MGISLFVVGVGTTYASLISWQITGEAYQVDPALQSRFSVGDSLNATLTFDTVTPDAESGVSYRGKYNNAGSIIASVAGYVAQASDNVYVTIINNHPSDNSDRFLSASTSESTYIGDDIGDYSFSYLGMYARNDAGTMFSSIDLPISPPNNLLFDTEYFYIGFQKPIAPNTYLGASVRFDNIRMSLVTQPIPEPITFALLAAGIGLFNLLKPRHITATKTAS